MATATAFLVPLHLQDLELPKADRVCVRSVQAFDGASLDDVVQLLRGLSGRVLRAANDDGGGANDDNADDEDDEPALLRAENFDLCYSLVKKLGVLSEAAQVRVLLAFTTILNHLTRTIRASAATRAADERAADGLRNEFKASVYFLVMAMAAICRLRAQADQAVVKQKNSSSSGASKIPWGKHMESALHALNKSICDEAFGLWRMNLPEEEFANLYCRAAINIMENSVLTRAKTMKAEIYKSIGSTILRVPSVRLPFVASIVDLIFNHEHLTNALVELTEQLPTVYEYATFPGDLIREISTISSGDPSKDVNGTRNISNFLTTLSTKSPALIISNLTFVLGLLESESYQLRNSGVACIASILLWSFRQQGKSADDLDESEDEEPDESEADDEQFPEEQDDVDADDGLAAADANDDDEDNDDEGESSAKSKPTAHKQRGLQSLNSLSRTTRDQLLTVLEERVFDVNSFARSHVLKMWYLLCESGAVPITTLKRVTGLAIGRLQDKAAVVRRHSIALLTLLLHNNPFMGKLDRGFHMKKQVEIRAAMEDKRKQLLAQAQLDMSNIEDEEDAAVEALAADDGEQDAQAEREFTAMKRMLDFHGEALEFIDAFETSALKLMEQLLGSKSTTDALEAMNFIRQAHQLKLSGADDGFKKLLPLIWKSDQAVREEVLNVFVSLFLRPDGDQTHTSPEDLAMNLLQLLDECSVAEFTCIEKIIRELQQSNQMPSAVVSALWDFVDSDRFPAPVITNSLLLLGMVASADTRALLAGGRFQQVLSHGFGLVACTQDPSFRLFGAACRLIQNVKFDALTKTKRLQRTPTDALRDMIVQIQRVLALEEFTACELDGRDSPSAVSLSELLASSTWFDAVQQAIDAIFAVCERPEEVSADVIKCLAHRIFSDGKDSVVDSVELAHFLFVLGHVAIQSAIRVEQMAGLIKRLRANQEKQQQPESAPGSSANQESNADANDVAAMEDELGVTAEVEAEEEAFVQDLIRQDIVCRHLLGLYGPLVVRLLHAACTGESYDAHVVECAVVALSKFMAVSDEFCERNLQLLFTLLQESAVPTVRANIVVALGDLAFRFPNLIEPWTSHLYNRLRDVDDSVRKNTTVVLSHLILNDMVKVKGQISEIAISLVDANAEIRNLVQLFFTELSKKGNNPIYNIFPDTVGQLSTSELVSTKDFDQIIKFLLNFITKDKHIESIVEKICQRYSAAHAKQRRDFSFCLAHAQHTEKSLRYMNQSRKLFKESLADATVQDHFKLLIARARRQHNTAAASTELKEVLDQLEQFVLDDAQTEENEEETTSDLGMPPTPGKAPRTPSKAKKTRASTAPKPPPARRASRKTRKQQPSVVADGDDDNE